MFRRIELINHFPAREGRPATSHKSGLMGLSNIGVAEAWIEKLRGPERSLPANARFYFTEAGWREVGRAVVEACQRSGQEYRVIAVKENSVEVVWRDKHTDYEVAAQPKHRRP